MIVLDGIGEGEQVVGGYAPVAWGYDGLGEGVVPGPAAGSAADRSTAIVGAVIAVVLGYLAWRMVQKA